MGYVAAILLAVFAAANAQNNCPNIVARRGWGARPAKQVEYIIKPVQYVVIQHTVSPICTSMNACAERVRSIQAQHMTNLKFEDIGYSFLVGGDGNVYEGRGWHKQGAHTRGYNKNSIGIAVIGDFTDTLPPRAQLEALKKLLECGVQLGELSEDYKLLAARQVVATQSPGLALYQELQTWPAWVEQP
ncbi:peptidoglycan-recognition protein SA-like [Schistocerca piceifrons]|uniref:peptidoglycan-recognition protein SA-like n=1 Tax=Schistocerca piceifrons TaxID=274613 RepID=UPI001F5ED5D0|nr:peptidoglycan-recognition protein SA-like [Schistocerca piceifrons]XP_049776786.1 peptidoglycan-recognition protein SA-like [Schistocerca cancellata]